MVLEGVWQQTREIPAILRIVRMLMAGQSECRAWDASWSARSITVFPACPRIQLSVGMAWRIFWRGSVADAEYIRMEFSESVHPFHFVPSLSPPAAEVAAASRSWPMISAVVLE